jgi:hypothetical protein
MTNEKSRAVTAHEEETLPFCIHMLEAGRSVVVEVLLYNPEGDELETRCGK